MDASRLSAFDTPHSPRFPRRLMKSVTRSLYRLSTLGLARGPRVTRYFMYQHLNSFGRARPADARVLSISDSALLAEILNFTREQVTEVAYPQVSMLDLPFPDEHFDAVVSDQVLEHVEGRPDAAVRESLRVVKPGGLILHTTCFINPIHGRPHDYWRFTPEGLAVLVPPGAKIIDLGGWGNPLVWGFAALGLLDQPIPHARAHPAHWLAMKNDPLWPIVTWVLARKDG